MGDAAGGTPLFVSPGIKKKNTTAQLRCYSVVIATAEGAGAPYIALDSTQSLYCQPLSVHWAHGVCLLCPLLFICIAACTLHLWEREIARESKKRDLEV